MLEASVFRALCTRSGWDTYHTLVEGSLWNKSLYRDLYKYMDQLHAVADGTDLTVNDIRAGIASVVRTQDKAEEFDVLLEGLAKAPFLSGGVLRQCVNSFISREKAMEAAREIVKHQGSTDFDPQGALRLLQESVELKSNIELPPVYDYLDSDLPSEEADRPNLCPLRLSKRLDRAIGGGVASGEVLVILAGPKKGKTSVLSLIGLKAALAGRQVMHVTLEVNHKMAMRRYDSGGTRHDYKNLIKFPDSVKAFRQLVHAAGGNVQVVDWLCGEHSPAELAPLAGYYKEKYGKPADLIIVDYLGLMIPDRTKAFSRKEQRHLYSKLGKDIRGMAKQLGVPIVTAWQTNRAGSDDLVEQRDIAESWDIIMHADIVLGISRSKGEMQNRIMRIHTVLSRYSEKACEVSFKADLERNQLEEIQ